MKRILAINDLTTTSRAAMQLQASIVPLFGHELNMLPTMLYSTHLGFKEVASLDCSSFLTATLAKFKTLNIAFSSYYLCFLVNEINISSLIDFLPKGARVYFDPIMADDGRLYSSVDSNYPSLIRPLLAYSYVITPNLYEACLLLKKPFNPSYSHQEIKAMLVELANLGPQIVVITGVSIDNLLGSYLYDKIKNEFMFYGKKPINYKAHGTGDIFSSCFIGSLEKDNDSIKALKLAVNFTYRAILISQKNGVDLLYGLEFEPLLKELI